MNWYSTVSGIIINRFPPAFVLFLHTINSFYNMLRLSQPFIDKEKFL